MLHFSDARLDDSLLKCLRGKRQRLRVVGEFVAAMAGATSRFSGKARRGDRDELHPGQRVGFFLAGPDGGIGELRL